MSFILIAAALFGAQEVPTDNRTTLWQNVRAGMSRAEVRALYPVMGDRVHHRDDMTIIEDFQVTDDCKATVRVWHRQGSVQEVVVRGESSIGGRCSDTVLTALSSRYGEALSRERGGDGLFRRVNTAYVWHREGVTLRFRKFNGTVFGGGGLGAPSWELTYSEVEDNVAL